MPDERNTDAAHKFRVLFLCTGNSCRSRMAEGWANHLKGDVLEAYSAGVEVTDVDPVAVKVMAEVGIDISLGRSTHVSELVTVPIDYVVTVCSHARETCPVFPGSAKKFHKEFDDPPFLTRHMANQEDRLVVYRRVRDEIRAFVESLPGALDGPPSTV